MKQPRRVPRNVVLPKNKSLGHLPLSDFADGYDPAEMRADFLVELAKPGRTVRAAAFEVPCSGYMVRTWREQHPEFDWQVRITLLTNGTGRWLCGASPAMTLVLQQEAAKPASERRSWEQVQEAIVALGGRVERPIRKPGGGRPRTPHTDEQVEKLLDLTGPKQVKLVEAAKRVGLSMRTINHLRAESPSFDWELRLNLLRSGRMLPGGSDELRSEVIAEWKSGRSRDERRQWPEVEAEIARRKAIFQRPGDFVPDAARLEPAAPGSLEENF